jgi:hypothetical protein
MVDIRTLPDATATIAFCFKRGYPMSLAGLPVASHL